MGRVFGVTKDATGANLSSRFAPWSAFKSISVSLAASRQLNTVEWLDDIERYGS